MQFKNKDIYTGVQEVTKFSQREIPLKVGYAVGKSLVRLREQFQLIEDLRTKKQKEHAIMDGDGKQAKNEDGTLRWKDWEGLVKEVDALQEVKCDIDVYSISSEKFMDQMETKKCKECGQQATGGVSSDEMAALIKLGIVRDDDNPA